ncbi:MAG: MFS transporter [Cyanobacteria bacterium J06626_23]
MRQFTILCLSRLIAAVGGRMADFALTLWVWDQTGSATALALTGFFYELPRIMASLSSGILIDRVGCKALMILQRVATASSTLVMLLLHLSGHLAIWHLYALAFARSGFEKCGWISYQSSVALIVEPKNYTRANSLASVMGYGSSIVAPAAAAALYPQVGLGGILPIQLGGLLVAIAVLAALPIPRPEVPDADLPQLSPAFATAGKPVTKLDPVLLIRLRALWADVTFGVRYVWRSAGLRTLLIISTSFWFVHGLSGMVYDPMILARTDSSSGALGAISTASGFGGIAGALLLTIWGGFRQTHRGMLTGMVGAGLAKIGFGLGRGLPVWIPAQFGSSFNFPLLSSSETALWMSATPAHLQGRVFAARAVVDDVLDLVVVLSGGVLGDALEVWLRRCGSMEQPSNVWQLLVVSMFGTGAGAGYALFYVGCAVGMLLIGFVGFRMSQLRLQGKTETV